MIWQKKFVYGFVALLLACNFAFAQKQSNTKTKVFDKIIFHTGACYGFCPTYHLEINSAGKMKLHAETVYKEKTTQDQSNLDTKKIGYFLGALDTKKIKALENAFLKMGADTIVFNGPNCCDAPFVSLILYYGGKKKSFSAMFPPEQANLLINLLNQIYRETKWQRSKEKFDIEAPEGMR